ncbi:hypothetical protein ACYPKM_04445 [Pseudomonas aeruginosa]
MPNLVAKCRIIEESFGVPLSEHAGKFAPAYQQLMCGLSLAAKGEVKSAAILISNIDQKACRRLMLDRWNSSTLSFDDMPHAYWRTAIIALHDEARKGVAFQEMQSKIGWLKSIDRTLFDAICSSETGERPLHTVPLLALSKLESLERQASLYKSSNIPRFNALCQSIEPGIFAASKMLEMNLP